MRLEQLPDLELERAANGAAQRLLDDRQRRAEQREQRQAEQRAEQRAVRSLQGLPDDVLGDLADNPRTSRNPAQTWRQVPQAVWEAGWTKDRIVEKARAEQRRQRERRREAAQARQTAGESLIDLPRWPTNLPAWLPLLIAVVAIWLIMRDGRAE